MSVAKKAIIVVICFTAVMFFMYRKSALEEMLSNSEQNIPTQSPTINVLYKNSIQPVRYVTHSHFTTYTSKDQDDSHGYLLSVRIMEQQTTGAKNVLQLGCLAMTMGLRAVEPFAEESFFFYPLSNEKMNLEQSFSDYYSSVSVKTNYQHATFDKWDAFINRAPKKIIFVCVLHEDVPYGSRATVIPADKCHITKSFKGFIITNGFALVRCINYIFTDETGPAVKLTDPTEFSRMIFGPYQPSDVNVIFGKWKGLGTRTRIPLDTNCRNIYSRHLMPSESLMAVSDEYIRTYLQDSNYISIMLRTEKVILHLDRKNENDFSKELTVCYQKVHNTVAKIREASGKKLNVFMTVDVGLFGTKGDEQHKTGKHMPTNSPVYQTTIQFMEEMYGDPHWSLTQWEQTFLDTVHNKNDSGYIAGLQRTIATKSTCLIVMGGGSFQQLAVDLYENLHSAQNQACLFKVCW